MGVSPFSILGSGSTYFGSKKAKPVLSIFYMILSTICFVAVTVIVKFNGPVVPAAEAAFLRYLVGLIMFLPFFYLTFFGVKDDADIKSVDSMNLLVNWKLTKL